MELTTERRVLLENYIISRYLKEKIEKPYLAFEMNCDLDTEKTIEKVGIIFSELALYLKTLQDKGKIRVLDGGRHLRIVVSPLWLAQKIYKGDITDDLSYILSAYNLD